jgi:hypothetical protein
MFFPSRHTQDAKAIVHLTLRNVCAASVGLLPKATTPQFCAQTVSDLI